MHNPYAQALDFLVDAGVTTPLMEEPNDRFEQPEVIVSPQVQEVKSQIDSIGQNKLLQPHADVIKQANELAKAAETLDELNAAIQKFDGLSLKKMATNMVFCDGNPDAKVMIIGDAPGADEDRQGKPFVGEVGQLLDKIFDCINLNRTETLYISNILNWRPPGNRTPLKEEMEIASPFIKRHIELVNPDMLVLLGGMAAQTLLGTTESISRLRGKIHDYDAGTKAIATYHPSVLMNTPMQKKKVWQDMLMLQDHLNG